MQERFNFVLFMNRYMDTKCIKGLRELELHRNHIMYFYNILENKKALFTPYSKKNHTQDFLRKKRVSDLGDLLLPDVQKRRLFKVGYTGHCK